MWMKCAREIPITRWSTFSSLKKRHVVSSSSATRLMKKLRLSRVASSKLRAPPFRPTEFEPYRAASFSCSEMPRPQIGSSRLAESGSLSMNDVVICFFAAGGYDKSAQGLAGAGRRLADELGGRLRAIVVGAGADAVADAVARIADSTTVANQAELAEYHSEVCLSALATLCGGLSPRAVLLGNDAYSQEIAARLAHRLGGSAVGDGVEVRAEAEALRVTRQVYGGKAQAVIELK